MKKIVLILLTLSVFMPKNFTAQNSENNKVYLDRFLTLGPIDIPMPAFSRENNTSFDEENLLEFEQFSLDQLDAKKSAKIFINENKYLQWKEKNGNEIEFSFSRNENPQIVYAETFLQTDRFLTGSLNVESCQIFEIFLDGKSIGKKTNFQNGSDCESQRLTQEIKLETGKHKLLIKSLGNPSSKADWKIKSSIILDDDFSSENLEVTTSPETFASVKELLEGLKVGGVSISADGKIAAVTMSKVNNEGKSEEWIELYNTDTKKLLQSFRGGVNFSSITWSPKGKIFAYTADENNQKNLWIADLGSGENYKLLENVENLSAYNWSPNAEFIIYSITEKPDNKNENLTKYDKITDRWPWSSSKNYIYLIDLKNKFKRRLTAGSLSTDFADVSPDGKKIIFSKTKYDVPKRPYSEISFYILDLESMKIDSLLTEPFITNVIWGADQNKLLFLGGPSSFNGIGKNIPEGIIPNDYDTQAFIYDLNSKNVEPVTKTFKPKVLSAKLKDENTIYFSVLDESFQRLYKYNLDNSTFTKIDLGIEYLNEIDIAENSDFAVYTGSSSNIPRKAFLYNFEDNSTFTLVDPEQDKDFVTGEVKDWNFKTEKGEEIKGRIYFPPDFDQNKKYPAIVYYYGGTNPITREFEGRYPKNIWAANGYIVYTLQPSGATGFGQEFSAYHVNDWGEITSKQIIEGTKQLLEEHSFIDPEKVGCLGASYGGFMTLALITKTDIFSAAISHAGISNLANYWGAGYWGVSYSAVATAESFPWNRKDIYVDRSPLFSADKINTPLLLLHGGADTNVPPAESIQMFAALKVQGKDVKLVEVPGLDHWIMEYNKRKEWTKTIIAYFDKYLKDQPQWWEELFDENK